MKLFRRFVAHLAHWSETYAVWPLLIGLIVLAIQAYHHFNQRPQYDDPLAALIAALNALMPLVVLTSFVCFIHGRVLGYRAEKEKGSLVDEAFDAIVFMVLLWLCGHISGISPVR